MSIGKEGRPYELETEVCENLDGTFVLTRKDQTQFLFSTGGKLTSVDDKNGNAIKLTYGGTGNLVGITEVEVRPTTLPE
jgi:YD repeat-containing protein